MRIGALLGLLVVACSHTKAEAPLPPIASSPAQTMTTVEAPPLGSAARTKPRELTASPLPLPDAKAPASLDYLAVDRLAGKVYVPEGTTGSLDVLDVATGTFRRLGGFATRDQTGKDGKMRTLGPSAVTVGDGVVYVGDRATHEVCAVDAKMLRVDKCLELPTATDGVAYVAPTKEVWVTTPRDHSLTILDASVPGTLRIKATIALDGDTEGYGVDDGRGLFFTNLEDKGTTIVLDARTRAVRGTWNAGCGAGNARGLAVDAARGFVFVACVDRVRVLDAKRDGLLLGTIDTGAGVDNIDYLDSKKLLYAAAGTEKRLTVASIDDQGGATVIATGTTSERARNPVADGRGRAYVADALHARLLAFEGAASE